MSKSDEATAYFAQGYACSQAVVSAFAADCGIDREILLRIAAPFGGGIGQTGGICGALTGALVILGLQFGSALADPVAKQKAYQIGREFVERFRKANGQVNCRDLLGHDVSTPEGLKAVKDGGLGKTVCLPVLLNSVAILEQMLKDSDRP
jgi:C_GCAxxG_C_C family probable redox protein